MHRLKKVIFRTFTFVDGKFKDFDAGIMKKFDAFCKESCNIR